jgi:uracil-DNA glycosylase
MRDKRVAGPRKPKVRTGGGAVPRTAAVAPAGVPRWRSLSAVTRAIVTCEACPRLRAHCARVAIEKRRAYADHEYWGRPVPGFGDPEARLVIVGLAPGAHGANRTGRVFTGDSSGDWLYEALHRPPACRATMASDSTAAGSPARRAVRRPTTVPNPTRSRAVARTSKPSCVCCAARAWC